MAVCLIAGVTAFALSDDLSQRLHRALAGTGNGDLAVTELKNKDLAAVDHLLADAPLPDDKARADLMSLRGVIAFLEGNMNAAASNFGAAQRIAPLADGDTFTEAMALVNLGSRAEARKLLRKLTQSHPERPIYIYWLGRLDYDEHRYEEAAAKLQQSLALDPKSARAWDSLGLAFDMQGRADQAQDAFEKAAALNRVQPHPSPWPPHDFGYWLLRMNRVGDAEAAFRESLHYDPAFAQAHYHLGRTLEKEDREPEAISEYLAALKTDQTSADVCYSLAVLYRKLHREPEAAAMFAEYKKRRQALP